MKNFDEFSNGIKLNESEIKFLNEQESEMSKLGSNIVSSLEDNDIHASSEIEDDGSVCIKAGGEDIKIKKDGDGFVISSKNNKDEKMKDEEAVMSWWSSSFVPSYKAGEAEHKAGK